jgi:hypothetical protein
MAIAKIKTISEKLDTVQLIDNDNDRILYVSQSQFPSGTKIVVGGSYNYREYTTVDGRATVLIYGRKILSYSGFSIWTGKGKTTSNINPISKRLRRILSRH